MGGPYSFPKLGDWRLPMVRFACGRCDRKGQYRRDTLIAKYGLEETMPNLRHLIAQCPRVGAPGQACGAYYADRAYNRLTADAGSSMTASFINDPEHTRKPAEQARMLADHMGDEVSKQMMLRIADDYERETCRRPRKAHVPVKNG